MINSVFLIRRGNLHFMGPSTKYSPPTRQFFKLPFFLLPSCGPSSSEHTSHSSLVFFSVSWVFYFPPYLWFCPLTDPLQQMASTAQVPPGLSSRQASPEQSPGSLALKWGSGQTNLSVHLLIHPTIHAYPPTHRTTHHSVSNEYICYVKYLGVNGGHDSHSPFPLSKLKYISKISANLKHKVLEHYLWGEDCKGGKQPPWECTDGDFNLSLRRQ